MFFLYFLNLTLTLFSHSGPIFFNLFSYFLYLTLRNFIFFRDFLAVIFRLWWRVEVEGGGNGEGGEFLL